MSRIDSLPNVSRYFQIEDANDGVYADRALAHLTLCCTWSESNQETENNRISFKTEQYRVAQ